MKKLNLPNTSYTFADYFKLNPPLDQLTAYFGYDFGREKHALPHSNVVLPRIDDLKLRLDENLLHATLSSEIARREFLIAPVITEVIMHTHRQVRVEYPVEVDDKLKGSLDYLLEGNNHCLVIEAKNGDLEQGFVQLAVELIALDLWLEDDSPLIYGALSIGNVWQFGVLRRAEKHIIQDLNLFRVPADVEDLMRVMIAVASE